MMAQQSLEHGAQIPAGRFKPVNLQPILANPFGKRSVQFRRIAQRHTKHLTLFQQLQ
jgi:hypothetical protein